MSRWWLREQMLDGATRGGGRATRSVVVATEDDDDGWDLPPPPARRRRMRRCRCPLRRRGRGTTRRDERGGGATTRDESGRWTTQGERVESDEGATRWQRTATEVRGGEEAACREDGGLNQIRIRVELVLSKFSGALKKYWGNSRPQTPLSYTSKKNRVVLKQNSQCFFSADLSCESASHHFAQFLFLRRVA